MKSDMKNIYELTDVQINTFHQKGWVGPLDAFSVQEVDSVKKELEAISQIELFGEKQVRTFQNSYFGIKTTINHHFACKSLSNLLTDRRIVHFLNQLGEENLLLWRSNIFNRMPKQEGIDWHQAIEYYGTDVDETEAELIFPEGENIIDFVVWIALMDISPDMGLLNFANGSHQKKFQAIKAPPEQGYYQEEKYYQAEAQSQHKEYSRSYDFNENEWEIESVPAVKAGQIVIFTPKVMHKATYNATTQERWVVNGRYIRPSVKVHPQRLIDDYRYEYGFDLKKHFCILVSGKDDSGLNQVVTKIQ
ncbi:MAG: hypothetical protein F6K65_00905 [Moorea sp. SIO3C2]|nr:hypothetical protein [Moorena sp. SIO3C2]